MQLWALGREQGYASWSGATLAGKAFDLNRQDRPLLQNPDPEAVMRGLIDARYPVYAQADVTVESRDVQHGQMVNDVIRALAQWDGWEEKKTQDE